MLFDLRGKGRRRTVKVVYSGLALLLGGGLVLFGVGSDTQGGLFDAFKDDNGNNTDVSKDVQRDLDRAEAAVRVMPRDPARWAALTDIRFKLANLSGYDENARAYTTDGKALLRRADQAWQRYLALDPDKPDPDVARRMVQAYDRGALEKFDGAVRAQEIVVDDSQSLSPQQRSNLLGTLAILAYSAKQERKGDLAAKRAVELAPETQRKALKDQIDLLKTQIQQPPTAAQGGAAGSAAPSG